MGWRVLLMLIVPVLVLAIACGDGDDEGTPTTPVVPTETTPTDTPVAPPPPPPPPPTDGPIVIVEVQANSDPYVYSPADFELEAGKRYRFVLTSDPEFHTFTANDLGVNVNILANTTETVEFVADQPGTYKYICIPHEFEGMVGTITVR